MKSTIKKLLTSSLMLMLLGVGLFGTTQTAYAIDCSAGSGNENKPACQACAGINAAGGDCSADAANSGFGNLIKNIINILSVVVGAVSVIMIIVGGFRYVVSGGDSNGVSGAKNTIMYALVGLVIVLFAQAIVAFVLDRATAG